MGPETIRVINFHHRANLAASFCILKILPVIREGIWSESNESKGGRGISVNYFFNIATYFLIDFYHGRNDLIDREAAHVLKTTFPFWSELEIHACCHFAQQANVSLMGLYGC